LTARLDERLPARLDLPLACHNLINDSDAALAARTQMVGK
jgi:hypothetical protein